MRGRDDEGFTLVEVMMAIGLTAVVMASTALFFFQTTKVSRTNADAQAAVHYATAAMEQVSQLTGDAVVAGRSATAVATQPAVPGVSTLLTQMQLVSDPLAATRTSTPLPAVAQTITVNGQATKFKQSFYVGACWRVTSSGDCTVVSAALQATLLAMYRVIVAITWPSVDCQGGTCSYVTSVLIGRVTSDPTFQ